MVRLLINAVVFLGSAAVGLIVAAWLLPDVHLSVSGSILAIVVFAVVQSVLSPFIAKVAASKARAFLGGVGLVSTFAGLIIASFLPGGLTIDGWRTWILATMVVWLVTALATLLLPLLFVKRGAAKVRDAKSSTAA